jgi:hypothetical protein
VKPDQVMLNPVPHGQTAQAFMAGRPVPYLLSWRDKDGVVQSLPRGKAWSFDPAAEHERVHQQFEQRRQGMDEFVKGLSENLSPDAPTFDHRAHSEWRDARSGEFGQPAPGVQPSSPGGAPVTGPPPEAP